MVIMSAADNELTAKLAPRQGVTTPEQAHIAISVVSKKILVQKAEPNKASNFFQKLPSGITNMFSENERENNLPHSRIIGNEEVIQRIKTEAGVNDEIRTRQLTEEGLNL